MRLSVVMATYNGRQFLEEQLDSLLKQERQPDEVVVADDASFDGTQALLEDFAERAPFSVVLPCRNEHRGTWDTFEDAFRASSGDVLLICDQDDIWAPEKLGAIESAFNANPTALMAFSDARLINRDNEVIGRSRWHVAGFAPQHAQALARDPLAQIFTRQVVSGCTMAIRRELLAAALPLPRDIHPGIPVMMYDRWLALLSATAGPVLALPSTLIDYRIHPGQQIGIPRLGLRRLAPRSALQASQFLHNMAETQRRMAYHQAHFEEIERRLTNAGLLTETAADRLKSVGHHLDQRSGLAHERRRRIATASREYRHPDGYRRYSLGLASALADMIRG